MVSVSSEDVYMVPPTSMWTGALYLVVAATRGMPDMGFFGRSMSMEQADSGGGVPAFTDIMVADDPPGMLNGR